MGIEKEALELVKRFQKVYFEERDIPKALSFLDGQITWMEIGEEEACVGLAAVGKLFEINRASFYNTLSIVDSQYQSVYADQMICLISGTVRLKKHASHAKDSDLCMCISILCRLSGNAIKLQYVHLSTSFMQLDERAGTSIPAAIKRNDALRQLVEEKNFQLEETARDYKALVDNIPGGMFRCNFDEELTIFEVSDGFLSLFGYTRQEIRDLFHDSFWKMIYPEDREPTLKEVQRQMKLGPTKEIEYRVVGKDGQAIWILDKGQLIQGENGQESFYCVLIDVGLRKQAEEKLRLSLERHKIIMDQTTDIIFEWNIQEDSMIYSGNWHKRFGYNPLCTHISRDAKERAHIHPEDLPAFFRIVVDMQKGKPYSETEFRIQNKAGQYIWCRIRASAQYDNEGIPVKAVGVIVDIDEEKKMAQRLTERAEQDPLTGLYNKITTQSLVEAHLASCSADSSHALLIMDVDNFKGVNDTWGHLFGDTVLLEIATGMKKLFRGSHVLGRIGGDEFIIFLKNISSQQEASKQANRILALFEKTFNKGTVDYHISCSIGIAFYPQDGGSFEDLYRKADVALYGAKRKGKNRCETYEESIGADSTIGSSINETIDSNRSSTLDCRLVEYVFRVLYQSEDINHAVSLVLEILGQQFDVSRAYIFENNEDSRCLQNTFEWCNIGIEPEIQRLQTLCVDDWGSYYDNFDENGIFHCNDIVLLAPMQAALLEEQNIKSVLQCALKEGGEIKGFVGFDECRMQRFWNQQHIDTLSFLSKILGVFLLRQRAHEKEKEMANQMRGLLDCQNAWLYTVDPKTLRILFINKKTRDFVSGAAEGMYCYQAFFGREEPCTLCPLHHGYEKTLEIYNPMLDVWTLTNAHRILWNGNEAVLLACYDITKYKKQDFPQKETE